MVQIENLPLVLTGLGLTASVLYYTMVLRNSNKAQQLQLETRQVQLFQTFLDKITTEMWTIHQKVLREWTWETPKDFYTKYGYPFEPNTEFWKLSQLLTVYESMGVLLNKGVFEIQLMYDMVGPNPYYLWEKLEPIIDDFRLNHEGGIKGQTFEYFEDYAYAIRDAYGKDHDNFNQRYLRRKQTRAKYGKTMPEYNT